MPFRNEKLGVLPAGERLYAIGDIHGRLDLFEALIEKIEADTMARGAADTRIVLLGDLIDRGPDSAAMVECARTWDMDFAELETLLGNHEASMLAILDGQLRWLESWLGYGGRETLASYGVAAELLEGGEHAEIVEAMRALIPEAHREWLKNRPLSIRRGGYFLAHAGVRPGRKLDAQEPKDLLWIRSEFLDSDDDHGAVIVHGHSIAPQPEDKRNRIGIDTGAYFSNSLTALGLEAGERWFIQT